MNSDYVESLERIAEIIREETRTTSDGTIHNSTDVAKAILTRIPALRASAAPEEGNAKAYVERAIASYAGDPADNQFQKGFLAALEVVRDEAFTVPSANRTGEA